MCPMRSYPDKSGYSLRYDVSKTHQKINLTKRFENASAILLNFAALYFDLK